ncbi:hypothetical protein CERZMDRAFT_105863 [Cercospora zeae-maydis SCOH1-5]|uniref:Chromo domain-containing protein n=1 Tax=Cercospora zeae-maydis SCOH1-5 TaxID=717836 RepID=A0A6A6FIR2_9PEZI|nr:hypothetical protein CERZMDRAFT_105863 [Cercospora zeae-maydis SCOH1-5]
MVHSKLFDDESSDEDSIRTDYTTEDDPDKEYPIDRILDYDKELEKYLIKWTGYPIQEATWEPVDGLPPNDSEIWAEWRQFLQDVEQGKRDTFDRADWNRRWQAHRAEKNQRRARRNVKRRRKNLWTRPDTVEEEEEQQLANEASDEEEDVSEDEPLASKATTVRTGLQQPIPRKGVAHKLKRARSKQQNESASSEDSSSSDSGTSRDSLVDELASRRLHRQLPEKKIRNPQKEAVRDRPHSAAAKSPKRPRLASESTRRPPQPENERIQAYRQSQESAAVVPGEAGSARKIVSDHANQNAPTARAKKSRNIMLNWAVDKKKRGRVPAPASLSHDGTQPRFQNLAMQNAVRKYSRMEAAPDINALDTVYPKSGEVTRASMSSTDRAATRADSGVGGQAPPGLSSNQPHAESGSIDSVYARRSPPPDARRTPSLSTSKASNVPGNIGTSEQSITAPRNSGITSENVPDRQPRHPCRYWVDGSCRFSADECPNPHFYPAGDAKKIDGAVAARLRLPPKSWPYRTHQLTCHFWRRNGKCVQDRYCVYAHGGADFDAPPPGVTIEDARASKEAYVARNAGPWTEVSPSTDHAVAQPPSLKEGQQYEPMSSDPQKSRSPAEGHKMPPGLLTCYFWRTREMCTKGDSCMFAHRDTGLDAAAPGMFGKMLKPAVFPASSAGHPNLESIAEYKRSAGAQSAEIPQSLTGRMSFGAIPQSGAPQVPAPSTIPQLSSEIMMSPTHLVASPSDAMPNEATRPSDGWKAPWQTNDESAAQVVLSATLKLYHAGDERPYQIRSKFEMIGDRSFTRMFGSDPVVRAEQAMLSSDVRSVLWEKIEHSTEGAVGFLHLDVAEEHEMASLAEICKLNDCVIIATVSKSSSTILIYPSDAEPWKFLNVAGMPSGSASLKFCAFNGCSDLQTKAHSTDTSAAVEAQSPHSILGRDLAHLDVECVFAKSFEAVFLMIPSIHGVLLEVYRQLFSRMKWKVYHYETAGAWEYFRRKYTAGVLLVHTDVPLWQVPSLSDWYSQATVTFTVGLDGTSAILEDRRPVFECSRILPLGSAVFLTDDLLVYHPEKAIEIIQTFLDANSSKPEGGESNKLVARPGVKQFLVKKFIDCEKPQEPWLRLYGAICDLCPPEDEDSEEFPNPLPVSNLISIHPGLLPSFEGLWEKDEAASTDLMVDWFAGWALLNASRFRRFVVCYLPKDMSANGDPRATLNQDVHSRGWAEKYQHVSISTPEKVLEKNIRPQKRRGPLRTWTK